MGLARVAAVFSDPGRDPLGRLAVSPVEGWNPVVTSRAGNPDTSQSGGDCPQEEGKGAQLQIRPGGRTVETQRHRRHLSTTCSHASLGDRVSY